MRRLKNDWTTIIPFSSFYLELMTDTRNFRHGGVVTRGEQTTDLLVHLLRARPHVALLVDPAVEIDALWFVLTRIRRVDSGEYAPEEHGSLVTLGVVVHVCRSLGHFYLGGHTHGLLPVADSDQCGTPDNVQNVWGSVD